MKTWDLCLFPCDVGPCRAYSSYKPQRHDSSTWNTWIYSAASGRSNLLRFESLSHVLGNFPMLLPDVRRIYCLTFRFRVVLRAVRKSLRLMISLHPCLVLRPILWPVVQSGGWRWPFCGLLLIVCSIMALSFTKYRELKKQHLL